MDEAIIRKIDDLGRVIIPKELRRKHEWGIGEELVLTSTDDTIVLESVNTKYRDMPICAICFAFESAKRVKGRDICASCLESISRA